MDSKKVIEKLIKIAEQQQKIIQKLAQALPPDALPTSGVSYTPGASVPAPATAPTGAAPVAPAKKEADTILSFLPANLRAVVSNIEVRGNTVYLTFQPGKASQQSYDAIKGVVQHLQSANKLPQQSYQIHVVD